MNRIEDCVHELLCSLGQLLATVAVLFAVAVPGCLSEARTGHRLDGLPQLVRGDDALSVAFGGAKETISLAMVHKADSYFHGGVDMECALDHDHDECCHHEHHSPTPNTPTPQHPNTSFPDPWAWINRHIRAPEIERHLEGEKAVELMPWLWASVKANPHNADAWTTAVYVADDVMRDPELAAAILAEAKAKNPESVEILCAEGRHFYRRGKGDIDAARRVFVRLKDRALEKCHGDRSALSDSEAAALAYAEDFLVRYGCGKIR